MGGTFAGTFSTTGAATLVAATTINGGASGVIFGGTIDGAFALTTNSSAQKTFNGIIGGTTPLVSISMDNNGSVNFNTSAVTTTGLQDWLMNNSPTFLMTINSPTSTATFTSTGGGQIRFGIASSTSVRDITSGRDAVVVNTAGITRINARFGDGSLPLASLNISNASGTSMLGGVQINTTGAVNINNPVTNLLAGGSFTVTSSSNGAITFGSTVDPGTNGRTLSISTGGTASFAGAVGATNALAAITVSAATINLNGNVSTTGSQQYTGAATIGGADTNTLTTTNSGVTFSSTTTLNQNLTVSDGTGATQFLDSLNGAHALQVTTTGATTLNQNAHAVGSTTPLSSITVSGGTTTINGASVTTTGAQSYNNLIITFGPVSMTTTNSNITIGGTTALAYNFTVNDGTVNTTFTGTLDSQSAAGQGFLLLASTGATTFSAAVGASFALTSVSVSGGTTNINGGSVTTTGKQTYSGNVTLGAAATLTHTGTNSFTVSGTTLSLGAFNLTNTPTSGISTGSISAQITGSGFLTEQGPGSLTLSGANTFTGGAAILGGTLSIGSDANLGAAPGSPTFGNIEINGGTLQATATFTLNPNRGIATGANSGSGTGTIDVTSGNTLTYAGSLADTGGTGALTKTETGTLTISGNNTFTGATTVSGGVLAVAGSLGDAVIQHASVTINAGATFRYLGNNLVNNPVAFIVNGTLDMNLNSDVIGSISGSGTIIDNSMSTFEGLSLDNMTSAQTFSGNISGGGRLGLRGAVAAGGTLTLSGGTYALSRIDVVNGTLNLNGTVTTTSDVIVGSAQAFSAPTTGSAAINLQGGSLTIGGALKLGDASLAGTFTQSGGTTSATGIDMNTGTGGTGTGTFTLSAGTFAVGASGIFASDTGSTSLILSGGTLQASATFSAFVAATLTNSPVFDTNGFNITYSSVLSGSGSLTKNSAGTLTLTGANAYSGQTSVTGGTLTLVNNTAAGTGAIGVSSSTGGQGITGTRVTVQGGIRVANALSLPSSATGDIRSNLYANNAGNTWSGPITLTGNGFIALAGNNAATLNVTGGISGASFAGTLAARGLSGTFVTTIASAINLPSGTLNVTNSGVMVVSSTGNTIPTVNPVNGTFRLGATNALPTNVTIGLGQGGGTGIFDMGGFSQQIGALSVLSGATESSQFIGNSSTTSNSTLTFSGGASTFGGIIKDVLGSGTQTVGLTVAAGMLTLSGANTYSGATTINAGTLQAGAANALSANSAVTLANTAGATLDLNNFNNTIYSLAGGGTTGGSVTLGSGTLTTGDTNATTTYGGNISGTGALTKQGSGIFTLSGANTYSGTTTIIAGTLAVNGSITSVVTVSISGTLGGSGTITGNVSNSGTVSPGSTCTAGLLTISGNYTQNGNGTLVIDIGNTTAGTGYDQLAVVGGGTTANLSGALTINLINSFVPTMGNSFSVLTFVSQSGDFVAKNGLVPYLTPSYTTTSLVLSDSTAFVVNTADSGAGSLRQAITDANAHTNVGGPDTIAFNIPTGDSNYHAATGSWTITPASVLPAISDSVSLDATTQPGYANAPLIEIDGSTIPNPNSNTVGLSLSANGSVVKGLDAHGFYSGDIIVGDANDTVANNYLGADITGTTVAGSSNNGAIIVYGANNTISNNVSVINNNGAQNIWLNGSGATGNVVAGNFIGTNKTGSATVGVAQNGVYVTVASNNTIGGTTAAARNVIAGSAALGIWLTGGGAGNVIEGNCIGTDATGAIAPGGASTGIEIDTSNNTVGGTATGAGNLVSGNGSSGISLYGSSATGNTILGNFIGVNAAGTAALANHGDGIQIHNGAANNIIGGTTAGARNIIGGNVNNGINIFDAGTTGNVVEGNYIGTDVNGTAALSNAGGGVLIAN